MTAKYSMADVVRLMACLRHPELGCNWDLKQTLRTLTSHTLEEVYEVVDAVEQGSAAQLCDELGDLHFQIVVYAQIAAEQQDLDFQNECTAIVTTPQRLHRRIIPDSTLERFGSSVSVESTAEQLAAKCEQIKIRERENKASDTPSHGAT